MRSGIAKWNVAATWLLGLSITAEAQKVRSHNVTPAPVYYGPAATPAPSSPADPGSPSTEELKRNFYASVEHPWRVVGGVTNSVLAAGWVQFYGKVVGVEPDRIRVEGQYSEPFGRERGSGDFFVISFPYQVTDNDNIPSYPFHHMAKLSGVATYTTVVGGSRTIRTLDYGVACDPPARPKASAEEIAESKNAAERKKGEATARTLKHYQDLAAKGDPYGQYRMGLRYATGDGVEKDLAKARDLLSKAAAQGQSEAVEELKKLQ